MSAQMGPNVAEATSLRIKDIGRQIAELEAERKMLKLRLIRYRNSSMLEAERIATAAEPYQATQLPKTDPEIILPVTQ